MSRWYKRNGADFIAGTMGLSLEAKGAYSLCLDLIYDRGGPIPDDARYLAGVCNVSLRKWSALRDALIAAGKLYAIGGKLSNARADLEIASSEFRARERAESGAKGGRNRAENAGQSLKNNDVSQAEPKHLREDKKREECSDAEASGGRAAEVIPLNTDPLELKRAAFRAGLQVLTAAGEGEPRARQMIGKWRKDYGDGTVLDVLSRAHAEQPSQPIAWIEAALRRASNDRNSRGSNQRSGTGRPRLLADDLAEFAGVG